jgi:hypothetical protein
MPKSKHGKGRRPQYKKQNKQPQTAATVQTSATAPEGSAPAAVKPAPAAVHSEGPAKAQGRKPEMVLEATFFTRELKRIAIISVSIVVILVVLSFIIK